MVITKIKNFKWTFDTIAEANYLSENTKLLEELPIKPLEAINVDLIQYIKKLKEMVEKEIKQKLEEIDKKKLEDLLFELNEARKCEEEFDNLLKETSEYFKLDENRILK